MTFNITYNVIKNVCLFSTELVKFVFNILVNIFAYFLSLIDLLQENFPYFYLPVTLYSNPSSNWNLSVLWTKRIWTDFLWNLVALT